MSPARFAVRQVVLVNLAFVVLMVAGVMVASKLPTDVFPDISFNSAILVTVWPGASPEEMERLVTRKIEDEVQDVVGIKEWFSFSTSGVSELFVEWDEALSENQQAAALADLRAAVDRTEDLPEDAEKTIIKELSVSEVFAICFVAISDTGGVGEYALREVARDIERDLERVPGVRRAESNGIRKRELRAYVDKARANQANITLAEISNVIVGNNQNVPAGTFSDSTNREVRVRGLGNFSSREALEATVVKKSPKGRHVTLGEVAQVVDDFEKRANYTRFNGNPAINFAISKRASADIAEVVAGVRATLESWKPFLPPGVELNLISDTSLYVKKRIDILRQNLALGIVSVIFILWFTVGFRNALLAIIGVPFSFLTAVILFPMLGITINQLSLVGLVMVSGMLVDDAIIVLENIYRHIEEGEPLEEAVIRGTEEVMWPVIASIVTTMAAFIPMLLVTGTSGEFMSILPKTVIACLAASLVEALFVLPAHYMDWGSSKKAEDSVAVGRGVISGASARGRLAVDGGIKGIRAAYLRTQETVLAHRYTFLACCVAAFYFSCGLSEHVAVDLFPGDFSELYVTVQTPVDFGIDETDGVVRGIEAALEPIGHEFHEFSVVVGEGMTADETPVFGSNYAVFYLSFPNTAENAARPTRLLDLVRETLEPYAKARPAEIDNLLVLTFRNGPPIGKPVAIRIRTEDYDLAKEIASEMKRELAGIPGVFNIEDNVPAGPRELRVSLDEHRASIHGLTFLDIGTGLRASNEGLVPSTFKDPHSDEDVDIRVLLAEEDRQSAADLLDVSIRTPRGYRVKIGDVASVAFERGYQRLYHYAGRRAVVVYADVDDQQATSLSVNTEMQARFSDIPRIHPGVSLVFGGEFQGTQRAFDDMRRALTVALIAIYAILAAQFRSYAQPLVVMCVIVFAYIGVVLGMWLWGYALSMYVIYALVGLAGIVVNDSLVLMDFVNKERERGTAAYEAVRLASEKRFRAILLTTVTTIAGLLPMALGLGGRSSVFGPFAAAIVAGLAVASLLTLFVVPALYMALDDLQVRLRRGRTTERQREESARAPGVYL